MWLLSRFETPFITVNGRHLFGDHTSFILLPLAAMYWILPSPKVLLAVQTFALGLGAWPAFLIARDKAFGLIIPAFLGAGSVYINRVPFGGPMGFVEKALTDPGEVIAYLGTDSRAWYVWQLFAPVLFLAWWAPSVMLIAMGPIALNLISSFPYQFDVRHHYSTLILPILIVATIFGVASAPPRRHRQIMGFMVVASLYCAYLWSPTPISRVRPVTADPGHPSVASFDRAQRLIPPNAIVSAYFAYVAQLSHREEIYVFPNPWKASNWGTFEQEGRRLKEADRVQYVIVPSRLGTADSAVLDSIRGDFTMLYDQKGIQLLKRGP